MGYRWAVALKCLLLSAVVLCAGCATHPTVYVYAKYLDESQKQQLQEALGAKEYHVELNTYDFPTSVTDNTIIYSLLLEDAGLIDATTAVAADIGLPIARTQGLAEGNHWYTKNSLAMFLLPQRKDQAEMLFHQDLVNHYRSERCGNALSLTLNTDGSYRLTLATNDNDPAKTEQGIWKYRQYPYIELQRDSATYSEYYFEISQFTGADKVSEIAFVKLTSLNTGALPAGCAFIHGLRV